MILHMQIWDFSPNQASAKTWPPSKQPHHNVCCEITAEIKTIFLVLAFCNVKNFRWTAWAGPESKTIQCQMQQTSSIDNSTNRHFYGSIKKAESSGFRGWVSTICHLMFHSFSSWTGTLEAKAASAASASALALAARSRAGLAASYSPCQLYQAKYTILLETPQKRAKGYLNISDIDYFKTRCCWDFTRKLISCWLWVCMHLKSCKYESMKSHLSLAAG